MSSAGPSAKAIPAPLQSGLLLRRAYGVASARKGGNAMDVGGPPRKPNIPLMVIFALLSLFFVWMAIDEARKLLQ